MLKTILNCSNKNIKGTVYINKIAMFRNEESRAKILKNGL